MVRDAQSDSQGQMVTYMGGIISSAHQIDVAAQAFMEMATCTAILTGAIGGQLPLLSLMYPGSI